MHKLLNHTSAKDHELHKQLMLNPWTAFVLKKASTLTNPVNSEKQIHVLHILRMFLVENKGNQDATCILHMLKPKELQTEDAKIESILKQVQFMNFL